MPALFVCAASDNRLSPVSDGSPAPTRYRSPVSRPSSTVPAASNCVLNILSAGHTLSAAAATASFVSDAGVRRDVGVELLQ